MKNMRKEDYNPIFLLRRIYMEILLNGAVQQVENNCNIKNLIEKMELTQKRLAVEVNLEIIPRSQFDHYCLSPGDRVEIVQAIGGG
jgi:thiamine biosynthesis protein ThiS